MTGQGERLAPGRYCLRTCYCGRCPHYQPLPARSAEPSTQPTTPARDSNWDTREESTWIDEM